MRCRVLWVQPRDAAVGPDGDILLQPRTERPKSVNGLRLRLSTAGRVTPSDERTLTLQVHIYPLRNLA